MDYFPGTRLQAAPAPTPEAALTTLIENRRVTTYDDFALSFFETHVRAEQVPLTFPHFVLTAMLRGRKVMHLPGAAPFEYLPGEAVLLPAHQPMYIDFPDARPGNPTQCLALEIGAEKVNGLLTRLHEQAPRRNPLIPDDQDEKVALALLVAVGWLANPQFTLFWKTPAQFQLDVQAVAAALKLKNQTAAKRPQVTLALSEIDKKTPMAWAT